jgi:hypothetical protein
MKVRCLEQIQKSGITFRTGETYTANEVNTHWYCIDAVGFETEEFHLHFEELGELTEEDASSKIELEYNKTNTVRTVVLDSPIVPGLSDEKEEEKEKKETFFDRLVDYIFL